MKKDKIDEVIARSYGNQISLSSKQRGYGTRTFYCHVCENWFYQAWSSIVRGYNTRCKCNHSKALDKSIPLGKKYGAQQIVGHRCLDWWDTEDKVPPPRKVGVPRSPRKGA
jgi:hypothetical protein